MMIFSESLKKNKDFVNVYENGKAKANKQMVMYVYHNGTNRNRLGISVSKKVGNSVVRHRVCRLIREAYRLQEGMFNRGLDIVVVCRGDILNRKFDEIKKSMLHVANLLSILNEE